MTDKINCEGFNSLNSIKFGVSKLYPDKLWNLKLIEREQNRLSGVS